MATREDPPPSPSLSPTAIDTKINHAKQLFSNGKFKQCKQLILEILTNGNIKNSSKLLGKLGDICVELGEYENAGKYFSKSIHENPNNASIYVKYGNLLHEYLNDNKKAETMYNKSIEIDASNDFCWFNFAKFMFKIRNYKLAEQYYLKCETERACINYHYAVLLLTYKPSPSHMSKAKLLLQKATMLTPNVVKYHHHYAQCLALLKIHDVAKEEYLVALTLSQYQDIFILYDYAKFLMDCLDSYDSAIAILQIAIDLKDAQLQKYAFIQQYYIEMKDRNHTNYDDYSDDEKQAQERKTKKKIKKKIQETVIKKNGCTYRWKIKPKPNGMKILQNLPIRTISKNEEKKEIACGICMEFFKFGERALTLPCFHWRFHDFCISDWLRNNNSCPVCLHIVTDLE